ncbi:MAG: DNA polymerase/3'-5' exonuclease PolX [Candidatus Hydrogenedentota bacterium]
MTNKEIAAVLNDIAMLLELDGENPFKSRAYTNVARQIEGLDGEAAVLAREGRLREIKGVGDALEQKITELVTTGKLGYYEELRAKFPESLFELFKIPGLGPKRIPQFYTEKGIDSIEKLELACKDGTFEGMKGIGEKLIEKILEGIEFTKQFAGRHLFNEAYEEAQAIIDLLRAEKSVKRIDTAGSLRRRKEVIGDIDIICSSAKPEGVMKRFVEYEGVARITGHGETKSSVVLKNGIAADLRVVSDAEFPYALAYFTGSKEHNVVMRQRAKDRGLKLNEYGLYDGEKNIPCKDEADIFKRLGLPYIPPEMREDMGEFALDETPELIELGDVIGLIHCHTDYSDGRNTIEQMARAAHEHGYKYITITDHSQSAAYAGGLRPKTVVKQHAEIDAVAKRVKGIRILKGIESDILNDGSLDYPDEILETFDLVVASVHSKLDMDEKEATARVVKAVEDPYTTILGHPTGRLLLAREGFPLNYDKVFDACAANGVAIEINANCHRLDLDWRYVRRARDKGCKLSIGPDAHAIDQIDNMQYGVGIARKGWLTKHDVVNCMTAAQFLKWAGGS